MHNNFIQSKEESYNMHTVWMYDITQQILVSSDIYHNGMIAKIS